MADKKISELTAAAALDGTELVPIVQGGETVRTTAQDIADLSGGREVLSAARTYYVRTDGSNSNTGLVNSSGGAFLTIQKAIDVIATLDLSAYTVTISVGNGTYTGGITLKVNVGQADFANGIRIIGDETTPSNCFIDLTGADCLLAGRGTGAYISGFKLRTDYNCLLTTGGLIYVGAMEFGTANAHAYSEGSGGYIYFTDSYSITGGAVYHIVAVAAGRIAAYEASTVVTLTGTPAFGVFAAVETGGLIDVAGYGDYSFSGSATGARYSATTNGVIQTYGAGGTYFPGDSAGSTDTGGQYA
jgi:hypothetical protein